MSETDKELYARDIPICVENFELIARKYRPVLLSNISKIHKLYEKNYRLEYNDLLQEALLALYKCIKQFKKDKGVYFGVYLKAALANSLRCFCRNTLPHRFIKDDEKSTIEKPVFKCKQINVGSLEDLPNYNS